MNNSPEVKIEYLLNYDLEISGQDGVIGLNSSDLNLLSNLSNINNQDAKLKGKKGFILSGGSVDESTGEVSGVLLDGTYTLFNSSEKSYNGIMGSTLSREDGLFINVNDYESKTGEQLEIILSNNSKILEEYNYYCISDSEHFISGNVYNIKWKEELVGEYNQINLDANSEGVYFIKTDILDDLGTPIYKHKNLPKDFDLNETYYTYNIVNNSHYIYTLKEQEQYITIKTENPNTYIKDIIIYFDPVSVEYATKISFSNAYKYDENIDSEIIDNSINSSTVYTNNNLFYIHNFGEDSRLTQIQINIEKWNKKNSLMKILKIVTGYTGIYNKSNLLKFDFNINKVSDSNQLRFGISSNNCSINILDNDLMINTLYKKDLIFKNIKVQIYIDNIIQGTFYINEKYSEKGTNEWIFDCIDRFENFRDVKLPLLELGERTLSQIIEILLSYIDINYIWEIDAKNYCDNILIPNSYFKANQSFYDLLLKCCQAGLLNIYSDRNSELRITRGV